MIKRNENNASKKQTHKTTIKKSFPIVGIGASAGGLEALEDFFKNTPCNSGLAFVVIQHLDPNHIGIMPELLQRTTNMKVERATDQLQIKPNHIYTIPANKNMSILNGCLYLFEPIESHGFRLPVDFFLRSLADDQNEDSIGIILSGMGSDGSLGLKAIKENNGIVAVQTPSSAKFDAMPQSAIKSITPDILAPPNEIPTKLIAFLKNRPLTGQKKQIDNKSLSILDKIVILLRGQTGHDFSRYKKNTLLRRIERRMVVHQIDRITDYLRFLQQNPKELDILFKEFLIGVTSFFRDTALWEKLKNHTLPALLNKLPNGYLLRAWVVGCSTGEEAYSLAIVFKEAYMNAQNDKNFALQIFATDIDKDAIEQGRKGFYSANITADVSSERINRFFVKEKKGFRIKPAIREMIVFAPHDVIKDPPFTKLDILLCRNLLIYMETELQKKLMDLFHYSLKSGGIMVFGSAENENSQKKLFTTLDGKLKIYSRPINSINNELIDFPSSYSRGIKMTNEWEKPMKAAENIQSLTEQIILQRFAPASVMINKDGDILYITGHTGKYLELAAGKADMNIYAMAREGFRHELPGAIRRAKQNFEPVKLHNILIETNSGIQNLDIIIQQIDKPIVIKGNILLIFKELPNELYPSKKSLESENHLITEQERELKLELQRVNEELQSEREEMRTTQEELKSTNEELQSTNEELQSTNEELTTSKEEMQSLNEELQTVNIELQTKITDYEAANNDMKNLLNSTNIATLFLDKELNIRRFTDQTKKLIKLRQGDIGRPFTDMVSELQYPKIAEHAREVLRTLVFKETEIKTNDSRWFTIRIMPYRSIDDRIDGLVITFVDNSQLKQEIFELNRKINNFETSLLDSNIILALCDNQLRYIWIFDQNSELETSKMIGKRHDEIIKDEYSDTLIKLKKQALDMGKPIRSNIMLRKKDKIIKFHVLIQPIKNNEGDIAGISFCATECPEE